MSARLTALSIGLALVTALGAWLHFVVVPDIAWQSHRGDVSTSWAAIRAAWPVYATAGGLLGLLGLATGIFAGETARERDALAQAAEATRQRDEARQAAEQAWTTAQAALASEVKKALDDQQEAAKREAAAELTLSKLDMQIRTIQQRNNALAEQNALLQRRLDGALETLARRKQQCRALQQKLKAVDAGELDEANDEIRRLRDMIADDRRKIIKLERKLRLTRTN